jgi:hypothetical protein
MGSSGGGTQRTEPPKYQLPFLQYGVEQARNLYNSGQQTVAGPSGESHFGLNAMAQLARNNSFTPAATNLAQQTLNGDFIGANPYLRDSLGSFTGQQPNPYLDAQFNNAAMATQGQLASQFAGAGRNVNASQDQRTQQLNDLATKIYGGAYEGDRNRQLQAIGMQAQGYEGDLARQQQTLSMSPALNQAQYADLDRLLGVGAQREGYTQDLLDAPGNALDQYLGRVSGNMGQTIKMSGGGNQAGGILGGALMGAQMGSAIPGIGTLIGAGIGGLGGYFGSR